MKMIEKILLIIVGNVLLTILIGICGYFTAGGVNIGVDVMQNVLIIALIVELYDRTKK